MQREAVGCIFWAQQLESILIQSSPDIQVTHNVVTIVVLDFFVAGVDTKEIMEAVAGSLRLFLFGTHVHVKYKRENGKEKLVLLPAPKGNHFLCGHSVSFPFIVFSVILKDMYRKFNARQQCEFRLLDRLKEACNNELRSLEEQFEPDEVERIAQRIEVFESPRRKSGSTGGGPGRPRKSGDSWLHLHGTSLATTKSVTATSDQRRVSISPVQNRKGSTLYVFALCTAYLFVHELLQVSVCLFTSV